MGDNGEDSDTCDQSSDDHPLWLQTLNILNDSIADVKSTISTEIKDLTKKFDSMSAAVAALSGLPSRVDSLEEKMQELSDVGDKVDCLMEEKVPKLSENLCKITESISLKMLDDQVHSRKWALVINGLDGPAGEREAATRRKTLDFAQRHLEITTDGLSLHACHRLSNKQNASVFIHFVDLDTRNIWLSKASNLKGTGMSISPDLPPAVRPIKSDILLQRKNLPIDQRKLAKVKYIKKWPYVYMTVGDKQIYSSVNVENTVELFLKY